MFLRVPLSFDRCIRTRTYFVNYSVCIEPISVIYNAIIESWGG